MWNPCFGSSQGAPLYANHKHFGATTCSLAKLNRSTQKLAKETKSPASESNKRNTKTISYYVFILIVRRRLLLLVNWGQPGEKQIWPVSFNIRVHFEQALRPRKSIALLKRYVIGLKSLNCILLKSFKLSQFKAYPPSCLCIHVREKTVWRWE